MSDGHGLDEIWPHVDGWPDPPPLPAATRADIEEYAGTRLAAQCMLDAEAGILPAVLRGTPEQAWQWGRQQWAKIGKERSTA